MLIKLMDNHNEMILINTDHVVKVSSYSIPTESGIKILLTAGEVWIPDMTIEKFLVNLHQDDNGKMVTAVCDRISHLEDAISAGLQYIGRSCH